MNSPVGRFSTGFDDPTRRTHRRRWQQVAALLFLISLVES
jgi:hypothetical protein